MVTRYVSPARSAHWYTNGGRKVQFQTWKVRLLKYKMPPVTAITEEKKDAGETAPSKPTIGIIYPPPEVRSILENQL